MDRKEFLLFCSFIFLGSTELLNYFIVFDYDQYSSDWNNWIVKQQFANISNHVAKLLAYLVIFLVSEKGILKGLSAMLILMTLLLPIWELIRSELPPTLWVAWPLGWGLLAFHIATKK